MVILTLAIGATIKSTDGVGRGLTATWDKVYRPLHSSEWIPSAIEIEIVLDVYQIELPSQSTRSITLSQITSRLQRQILWNVLSFT